MRTVLAVIVLLCGLALSAPITVSALEGTRTMNSKFALQGASDCGVSCADPNYCCPSGYFCVKNAICLKGRPQDYHPAVFVGAGVLVQLINDMQSKVSITSDCVADVMVSVEDFMNVIRYWREGHHSRAMGEIRTTFGALAKTWRACKAQSHESMWHKIISVAVKVTEAFFPEIKEIEAGYQILLHGVDMYHDFKIIMNDCRGACSGNTCEVDRLVNCGEGIGDFGYQAYKIIKSFEAQEKEKIMLDLP